MTKKQFDIQSRGVLPAVLFCAILVRMPIETRRTEAGAAVVAITGRLVLGKDVERLETCVKELLAQNQQRIVFDMAGLDYADSAGLGTFVSCLTMIKKTGGELRLAGVPPRIQRLLTITGLDQLMQRYPSVAEAAAG